MLVPPPTTPVDPELLQALDKLKGNTVETNKKLQKELDGMWEHIRQLEVQVALINTFISLGGVSKQ